MAGVKGEFLRDCKREDLKEKLVADWIGVG